MDDFEGKSGHFVRKSQLIAGGVLVGCLCLMVGLMCGLLPQADVCEAPDVGAAVVDDVPPKGDSNPAKDDPAGPGPTNDPEWYELRLPTTVKPTHYELLLHPNLTTNYFTGEVKIAITVTEAVKHPRLHIKAMDIMEGSVSITDMDGNDQAIDGYFNYLPNEFLVMNMTEMLAPGDYTLNIGFGGWLNQTIVGFYKSVYQDAQGNDRAIATSKFQPTDARRAFPCFDEPAFKANYTTSLVHPSDYIALSNMDVMGGPEDYGNGLMITHFNPSVPMSTYLACFIVCQFENKLKYTMSGIPFRVYAPGDVLDQVDYSLDIGVNITDYYEEYFDLGYPLPKLDMIAIPDYVSGATEHWGLITYREVNLLFDDDKSSEVNKQRVASVVAHELAHMWFGNIVTCDWWDDLWLNEGFASYLEYLGVNSVEPDWKMLEVFVTSDLHYVMGIDQIVSSHPIIVDIQTPDEINEVFDSIPYSKGASVIRMLNNFLGETVFRAGVSNFLKDFQYATAVTDDLWERLREAAAEDGREVDVKRVMDTWTLQMGFPVVTMKKVQEGDDYFLKGTQDWFLVDPNANKSADLYGSPYGDYIWEIPFHYRFKTQDNENREWMWRNESEFSTAWVGGVDDYYVANSDRMGYYRINYDSDTWNLLGEELQANYTALAEGERAGIIDDSFNLARANQLNYSVPLNMTKYLTTETEYVPWDTARDNFLWLGEIMRFEPGYGLYRKYVRDLTSAKYDELGWRDEGSHLETFIRSNIIDLACRHGNSMCLDEAVRLFYDYLNGTFISPDLSSDVFQFGMQEVGGQEEWKILFENYQSTDVSQERSRLLYGMAQTRIPWILANYLDMLLMDNSPIRSQDFFSVVGYVGDNPVGNPIAWDWARVNWEQIVDKFGIGSRSLGRMIPGLTEFYSTELGLQEMQDFFEEYPEAGAGSRGRQQALERVQGNINWVERNADVVYEWLQENMIM